MVKIGKLDPNDIEGFKNYMTEWNELQKEYNHVRRFPLIGAFRGFKQLRAMSKLTKEYNQIRKLKE